MSGEAFSEEGLRVLHDRLAAHLEHGAMPGYVALVASGGRVWVDVVGAKAFEKSDPMQRDDIFRIASLTKPIAAVGALVLVERGVLRLDEPVDGWLPELAGRRVLRHVGADLTDTVPARRAITLEDLLTYRMGFGNILAPAGTYPIQTAEVALQLKTLGPPWPPTPLTSDEWMRNLGSLPLMSQPGEEWLYNTGSDVLGVLIERAADQPLQSFLRECIFEPLGMRDTAFSVVDGKRDRLTTAYTADPATGALDILDSPEESYWASPPSFPRAGGWLLSTVDDYWAFVQMVIGGGAAGGVRVLSEGSARLMTTDHLSQAQRAASTPFLGTGAGWGFGLMVPAAGRPSAAGPRLIGWDGGTGTTWRSDIDRDLTTILFTQRSMTSPEPPAIFVDLWTGADLALG
jgi:CubicO group peptidase (beta-lactamase class C family)